MTDERPRLSRPIPEHEIKINFLDRGLYPFVREVQWIAPRRKGSPGRSYFGDGAYLIAYSELASDAPRFRGHPGAYERRIWYRRDTDDNGPVYTKHGMGVDSPWEGVLPESIKINEPSICAAPELWRNPRPVFPGANGCAMCGGSRVLMCNCVSCDEQMNDLLDGMDASTIPLDRLDLAAAELRLLADRLDEKYRREVEIRANKLAHLNKETTDETR
jgi:hypothetical protein